MTMIEQYNPFAEAAPSTAEDTPARSVGFAPWTESMTPFAEVPGGLATEREQDRMLAEAFAELRDEAFDEALAFLAEETEQVVADRFMGESPSSAPERERYADAQLAPVRFEAMQYLDNLQSGLAGMDVESLSEDQLGEVLDRFDPETGELTPASEEFIGSLVRKAKSAVKFVANAAKGVGAVVGKVAGAALGPILEKLKGLVNPLLRRASPPRPARPRKRRGSARRRCRPPTLPTSKPWPSRSTPRLPRRWSAAQSAGRPASSRASPSRRAMARTAWKAASSRRWPWRAAS